MSQHPATILVVDDTARDVKVQSTVLKHHGYSVVTAASGDEALRLIQEQPVDLVILDILLPGLDGYAVCERLRAGTETRFIPIIMVTAADNQAKVRALEAGADEFLQKPYDQAEVLARVRTLLRVKSYHDTTRQQAAELAEWNRTLELRVQAQVAELERMARLTRFLSPRLAATLVSAEGEALLETHRRQIAVLCCRLPGFSGLAESMAPEDVLGVLREFYAIVGDLARGYEVGACSFDEDRLRLLFNDPLPCDDPAGVAVRFGLATRAQVQSALVGWHRRGLALDFAAGVDYGYATLGTIGFEGRTEYGAVGSVVRIASALCDRALGGQVLVTQRALVEVGQDIRTRRVDQVRIEGFSRPIAVATVDASPAAFAAASASLLAPPTATLTEREWEVVRLIAQGSTNREIGETLVVAEGTAVRHVGNILNKLGLKSRAQVAAWAVEQGRASARSART